MLRRIADLLVCPACLPRETALSCHIREQRDEDIESGMLHCRTCGVRYPVLEGIARLLPGAGPGTNAFHSKYDSPALLASYLWSHYADLSGDPEAHTAYRVWADLMEPRPGLALDAGCATGRFTFEMSRRSDGAVGVDNSGLFIRAARQLLLGRGLDTEIPDEGRITVPFQVRLPPELDREKIEFIVGDVQALPFPAGRFSVLSSLNMVDKVSRPMTHLKEMDRVAAKRGAQFLISDPFSWSEEIADEAHWLGGTPRGPMAGRGADNIASLLKGRGNHLRPPWKVRAEGAVWWKLRNHGNHFELIRSRYVKAAR